jgi:hypothetical protein
LETSNTPIIHLQYTYNTPRIPIILINTILRIIRPRIAILDVFMRYFYLLRFILELGIISIHKTYYWIYLFNENFDIFDPFNFFYYYNPISNKYSIKNFDFESKSFMITRNKTKRKKKKKHDKKQAVR